MNELQLFKAAFEHSAQGLALTDVQGRLLHCNRAFLALSMTPDVMEREPRPALADLLPELHANRLREIAGVGEAFKTRCAWQAARGTSDGVEVTVTPVLSGKLPAGFVVQADTPWACWPDMDPQQFSAIVESSSDAIISKTLDGIITSWNRGAQAIFGYTAEEMVGQPMLRLIPPERVQEEVLILSRIAAGEKVEHFETARVRKDGQTVCLSVTISPVRDRNGVLVGASKIARDITHRRNTEKQLERYRENLEGLVKQRTRELETARDAAEAASRAKSTFLTNMSHEIRTPMNAIIGLAHLLESELQEPDQRDKLDKISSSANHLLGILNDVLDLSKIEAGHLVVESRELNVTAIVDHVCSMMAGRAAEKGLALHEQVDARLENLTLLGDALRMGQVLINFTGNALKFTDKGSVVVSVQQVGSDDQGVDLRFEVRDSGIGMTAEQQQRVFQPFEQAETSTSRQYGGTGLGLSISRRIANLLGGDVGVQSEMGQGSVFWFTVRLRHAASSTPRVTARLPEKSASLDDLKGLTVLLAEDHPINQMVARTLLERQGVQVVLAENGQEAVKLAGARHFDLILMDMQMPVLDGLQATRQIRQIAACKATPIIAMTANAFLEDRAKCFEAGMNDFVTKPVEPQRLFEAMLAWRRPAD